LDSEPSNKEIAKTYLRESIKEGVDSCLPYYLLANKELEEFGDWEMTELYRAIGKPDVFPAYFRLLFRLEKNEIRAAGFIRKGVEKFPHDIKLVLRHVENLCDKNKFSEALKVIKNGQPFDIEDWFDSYNFVYFTSLIFSGLKQYPNAIKVVQESTISKHDKNFLLGLIYFKQKRYKPAIENFEKAIEDDDSNGDATKASLYYLLNCFYVLKRSEDVEKIIDLLPKGGEWFIFPFHFHFAEFAEKTLKLVSKNNLDERLKSKLSGFIAAVILDNRFWRDGKFMEARELTKKEKLLLKNTIGLAKEAVRLHPLMVFQSCSFAPHRYCG